MYDLYTPTGKATRHGWKNYVIMMVMTLNHAGQVKLPFLPPPLGFTRLFTGTPTGLTPGNKRLDDQLENLIRKITS